MIEATGKPSPVEMKTAPAVACPRCGAPLAGGSVDGLCARCLGALNFDTLTRIGGAADEEPYAVPTVEELGDFFPQLDILSLIGRGGMGVVYKARQKSLHRYVALKLLAPERAGDPMFARRFANEARSLAALNHPHIVSVHDFGEAGGYFYLLMEFVDGVNLRQLIDSRRLTADEALGIITPVCEALQAAHERGIVHRDVKPENLLIDRNGTVKIADFGIARMMGDPGADSPSHAGDHPPAHTLAAGTPDYAAPEQRASAPSDHRADIYSLGVVLYEMITGQRPGSGVITPPSKRAAVDMRIDEVLLKALHEKPDHRFRTVAEFREQFQEAKERMEKKDTSSKALSPSKKRKLTLGTVASLVLIGVASTAWLAIKDAPARTDAHARQTTPELPEEGYPLEFAYKDFKEAFTELQYARRILFTGMPDGSPTPPEHAEKVRKMETMVQQLRERIIRIEGRK